MLLTPEEIPPYLDELYNRLLEHRYRYYILHSPVVEDWIYDLLESHYNALATQHGAKAMDMVDFNPEAPGAKEAGIRVDTGQDYYGLWEASMKPVWEKLGHPRYKLQEEKQNG